MPFSRFVADTDPGATLRFSVVLRLPGAAAMGRYLEEVADPAAAQYHRYLDPEEFGRRFGLSRGRIAAAEADLRGAGFDVLGANAERTAIQLRGSVGAVSRLFDLRMGDFRERSGRRFHSPLEEPTIPPSLSDAVVGVSGLNGAQRPTERSVPSTGLKPADVEKAYDIGPLHDQGIDGHGMTIGIVSFASFRQQDVDAFDEAAGTSGPAPRIVKVNGGSDETAGGNSGEVTLDIDTIRSVAPKAQIVSYEAQAPTPSLKEFASSFTENMSAVIDRIVADGKVDVVSISWGMCDTPQLQPGTPWIAPADRLRTLRSFQAAQAAGISIFAAAGDAGAYDCQEYDLGLQQLATDWPSDYAPVIAVGGTNLSVRSDGTYLQEAGWEDILERTGGGGGVNPMDPKPSWQVGPGVDNQFSNGRRQVPDVAADADPSTGFFSVAGNEKNGKSEGHVVGGTSAAAPFWAASMLLIEQYAAKQGVRKLGFVSPVLYAIAAHQNPKFPSFHDVTLGGNRYYDATPGWDFATGLGSPDVFNLARAMVDYARAHPAAGGGGGK
ncbi:MAG: protease pro-enzyme activation domain-containing protein [Actinomycetota bacterium]